MTVEELRDYVEEQRSLNMIPYHVYSELIDGIDTLEQVPRWIPVTKRQPKKSGKYWCTFGGTNLTGSDYYTTESDAKEIFDDAAGEYTGWQSQNVIAWMPLPESYRAESEE